MIAFRRITILFLSIATTSCWIAWAQSEFRTGRQKVIIDTDIGYSIDDVFAVALALSSPELELLGITTTSGDTQIQARLVDRLLCETGIQNVAVSVGAGSGSPTTSDYQRWAERLVKPSKPYPPAVDFILDQIRRYPNQITLIAIGPFTNVGGLFERDRDTAGKLKRIVIMGGSVFRGYNDYSYMLEHHRDAEYNIASDIAASRRIFASGVPTYVMPLDATQITLDETKRQIIFRQSTPLTDALTLLYQQWGKLTPTLYDPVAVAFVISPEICPTMKMRLDIDDKGFTIPSSGASNAAVCLNLKSDDFFQLYMKRLLTQKLTGHCN